LIGSALVHRVRQPVNARKPTKIKSAIRALEILELFSNVRKSLSSTEVGFMLGYPKSSANVLLKCLTDLGYLTLDPLSMQYFPTLRSTALGEWIPSALYGLGDAGAMLQEVHDLTGETVTLSMRTGMSMRFIRVLPGKFSISLRMEEGSLAPLMGSSVGAAFLGTRTPDEVQLLARSAAAMARTRTARLAIEHALEEIARSRKRGYSVIYGSMFPDIGAVAMALPPASDGNVLVMSVGGLDHRIRRTERPITVVMRNAITTHLTAKRDAEPIRRA
jgi:DNA-binding IclR family transcriptional regulator